ncbi:MAG: hypothetical protein Q7R35_10085 [Elusimicrobiota bacterium]|nr:hypothetical protein [Elusimicrobiota bacterium]
MTTGDYFVYVLFFSLFCSCIFAWGMARRSYCYDLTGCNPTTIIFRAAVFFVLSCCAHYYLCKALQPAIIDFIVLALLGVYIWYEDYSCREDVKEMGQGLRGKVAEMEAVLRQNPANWGAREGLSDAYEELGEFARALAYAKAAFRKYPSERNKWRIKTLTEKLKEDLKNRYL